MSKGPVMAILPNVVALGDSNFHLAATPLNVIAQEATSVFFFFNEPHRRTGKITKTI